MRRDENLEAEIARIVQSVNEWDDRTSPDDYPYHLLITSEELADILRNLAESLEFEALHLSHMDLLVEKAAAAGDAAVYEAMRSECFDPTIPDNVAEYVGNAIRSTLSAALSIEQTQPVAHLVWRQYLRAADDVEDYYEVARPGDKCVDGSEPFPVYAHRPVSALVNAEADADVVERWQPIDTAPRDGTPVDLWGVNHLHPRKTGRRATDVTWGRVRDWLGNERDDWQHGQGDDFEPTHWCPVPAAPLSSLRPAEVGSATKSKGQADE